MVSFFTRHSFVRPTTLIAALLSTTSNNMTTTSVNAYSIGTPGSPWGVKEKQEWLDSRVHHRSYQDEVVTKLEAGLDGFTVSQYGTLSVKTKDYPLFVAKSNDWNSDKPCVLITGGVHGYETSGVQGALLFLSTCAKGYSSTFNIVVAPCVSPWGYETIERWNAQAVDPNRSFNPEGKVVEGRSFNPEPATAESTALIAYLKSLGDGAKFLCHLDLHETTDTDKTEFRPAKLARDGQVSDEEESIPDGFYLVSDETNPQTDWHKTMIDAVRKITHIAPNDPDGTIIGETVVQEGVIAIPTPSSLGLCSGVTTASYATTTEVYPDSPKATPEQCNQAQVSCIVGALEYILKHDESVQKQQEEGDCVAATEG